MRYGNLLKIDNKIVLNDLLDRCKLADSTIDTISISEVDELNEELSRIIFLSCK